MLWSGRGWHCAYDQAVVSQGMKWVQASTADNKYRVWFGSAGHLMYIEISQHVHNPLTNPTHRFAKSGYHVSGWFDGAWSELEKLAIRVPIRTRGCTSTEKVRIFYGVNDSPLWTQLAEYTTDGVHESFFEGSVVGERGVPFYSIRFKIELERGDDATKTPVVEFFGLEYLKTQDASWGYSLVIDATRDYGGMTAREIVKWLEDLADKKPMGEFAYRNASGEVSTRYVKLTRQSGFEFSGEDGRGYYQVSLVKL